MTVESRNGRIVTFYSYKGGTGRSMALANVGWILASNGKRVLMLDWDLEAPGLHRYFHPFLSDRELAEARGVIDFVISYATEAMTPLADGLAPAAINQGSAANATPADATPLADGLAPAADWYRTQANILRYAEPIKWDFG